MMRGSWVVLAAALALVGACGDDDDDSQGTAGQAGQGAGGDAGTGGSAGTSSAGSAGTNSAGSGGEPTESLAAIQTDIFNVSCAFSSCHSPEGKRGNLVLGKGDVEPSSAVHTELVNVPTNIGHDMVRVKPGDPDNSFLVMKLRAGNGGFKVTNCSEQTNVCGDPMPQGSPGLDAAQIERVARWVKQGALDN